LALIFLRTFHPPILILLVGFEEGVMAYIPCFDYDIFISYCHLDNKTAKSTDYNWVDQFHRELELNLARVVGRMDKVKIWRDVNLDGSQMFDQVLRDRINRSAIFLALNSPSYIDSKYCRQELEWFCQKAKAEKSGLIVGERKRIFNVLLYNIPYDQWPREFEGGTGFSFFSAKSSNDLGGPLSFQEKDFGACLKDLINAVVQLVKSYPATPAPLPPEPVRACDVYVAEVADSLRKLRKRVLSELEQKGIKVYTAIPPPYKAAEHEQAVLAAMKKAKLSVHLIDDLGGAEIEDEEEMTYPQKQLHMGLKNAKSQLIWMPSTLEIVKVEDEQQKAFLEQLENSTRDEAHEFVRGMQSEIVQVITDKMEQLKEPPKPGVPSAALLDMHKKDENFAWDMYKYLKERNIQPYINPEDDDPKANMDSFTERLKKVGALIIFYGNVHREWVLARVAEAAKIVITEKCPVRTFCIYLAPPADTEGVADFDRPFIKLNLLDNRRGFNPDSLSELLVSLGAGGT
jgi:hypothetical protein